MDLMERNGYILRVLRAPDGYRKVLYRDENRSDEVSAQIRLKNLVWAIFFSFREKEKMSLTEALNRSGSYLLEGKKAEALDARIMDALLELKMTR